MRYKAEAVFRTHIHAHAPSQIRAKPGLCFTLNARRGQLKKKGLQHAATPPIVLHVRVLPTPTDCRAPNQSANHAIIQPVSLQPVRQSVSQSASQSAGHVVKLKLESLRHGTPRPVQLSSLRVYNACFRLAFEAIGRWN